MKGDVLFFPDAQGAGLSWVCVGPDGGKVKMGRVALDEHGASARSSRAPDADRVTLLAPGEAVVVHTVELPARTDAQARTAAPFAVEDMTAQPLDDVHVVAGPREKDSARREIAVVDCAAFAAWRSALEASSVVVDQIIPDFMAVPVEPDEVAIVDLGDRVLVRGAGLGFAIEADVIGEVLSAALEHSKASVLRLWTDRADALVSPQQRASFTVHVEPQLDGAGVARLFQRGLDARAGAHAGTGGGVDLSAADAGPDAGFAFDWRRWRVAAGLALVAGLSYAALQLVQIASLERERTAAYAEAEQILRAAFPDMQRIVNPRAQLRARLGAAGGGSLAFLSLSGLVADSVRDIESLQVETIRFDAARAELDVTIRYVDYADVERLSAAVAGRGGQVEEGGSRRSGELMVSDIVVRAQP